MKKVPAAFKDRIGYGLYGGIEQFYISGVDGTLAQLGDTLPPAEDLKKCIEHADSRHRALLRKRRTR